MTAIPPEYRACFRPGDLVSVGLYLADTTFVEDAALILALNGGKMRLELCGNGFPPHLSAPDGSRGVITRQEGRNVLTCNGMLKGGVTGRMMLLELAGNIRVNERREYARADVAIGLAYFLPSSQEMGRIMTEWEELKKCPGCCLRGDVPPCRSDCRGRSANNGMTRANFSGANLRFKIRECLSYGTLIHLKIALPDDRRDHIHAIGSVVRTRELLADMMHHDYYSTSVAFRAIDSQDRSRLVEYVLREQRRAIL